MLQNDYLFCMGQETGVESIINPFITNDKLAEVFGCSLKNYCQSSCWTRRLAISFEIFGRIRDARFGSSRVGMIGSSV